MFMNAYKILKTQLNLSVIMINKNNNEYIFYCRYEDITTKRKPAPSPEVRL